MFGSFMDKINTDKLDMQSRLDNMLVDGQSEGGKIKVVASAVKEIKQIYIDPDFFVQSDKEAIEELMMIAVNRALVKADEVHAAEVENLTGKLLNDALPDNF